MSLARLNFSASSVLPSSSEASHNERPVTNVLTQRNRVVCSLRPRIVSVCPRNDTSPSSQRYSCMQ